MNIPEGGQKFHDLAIGIISARYYEEFLNIPC
ncbi:hypothetical protein QE439_004114 [Pedobacter agri]|nr:hypothetical protein [Pedobacter agri]